MCSLALALLDQVQYSFLEESLFTQVQESAIHMYRSSIDILHHFKGSMPGRLFNRVLNNTSQPGALHELRQSSYLLGRSCH